MELPTGSEPLPAGLYTRAAFQPRLTFELANGWFVGSLADGFFDVQQQQGTPDAIAVQFGLVQRVIGAGSATVPSTKAEAAARTIHDNPGLVVVAESASRLGGLEGFTVEVDNQRDSTSPVLEVPAGMLAIDPDRRLWISLFDTGDGVLAVIVEGSVSGWERALAVAEPVLESIVIGEPLGAVRPRTRARIIHA